MKSEPGRGCTSRQSTGLTRSASGAPASSTTISACSGSVSWNSSTNRCDSRSRNVRRTSASSRSSVAGAQQQVHEIQRALGGLQRVVAIEAGVQVLLQGRRQVGVGAAFELAQRRRRTPAGDPTRPRACAACCRRRRFPCAAWRNPDRDAGRPAAPPARRDRRPAPDRRRWPPRPSARVSCRGRGRLCPRPVPTTSPRSRVQRIDELADLAFAIERVPAPRAPDDRAIRAAPCRRGAGARPGRPRRCRRRSSGAQAVAATAARHRPDRAAAPAARRRRPGRRGATPGLRSGPGTAGRYALRPAARATGRRRSRGWC